MELTEDRGKGVSKLPTPPPSETKEEILDKSCSQLIHEPSEERIFAKSLKTRDSLHFEDTPWYQRFKKFNEKWETITKKVKEQGKDSLDEDEKKWMDKYKKFKKEREIKKKKKEQEMKSRDEVDLSLLEMFFSKEYKDKWPAIKVFYPTVDWFMVDERTQLNEDEEKSEICTVSEQNSLNK